MKSWRTWVLAALAALAAVVAPAEEQVRKSSVIGSKLKDRLSHIGASRNPQAAGANAPAAGANAPAAGANAPAAGANAPAAGANAAVDDPLKGVKPGGSAIEFRDSPLDVVFLKYGELVNKTVLVDPSTPKVTITLQPLKGQDLTDDDKILAIEAVLEMNNIHLEPYDEKFVRAIPRENVRRDGILIRDADAELKESMHVATVKLPIKNIAVETAIKTLENFKSKTGINIGLNDAILATDTESNLKRMQEIVKLIDIPSTGYEMFFYQIEHATASGVADILKAIVEDDKRIQEKNGSAQQGKGNVAPPSQTMPRGRFTLNRQTQQPGVSANSSVAAGSGNAGMIRGEVMIIADDQTEKVIIKTDPVNTNRLAQIIRELDVETEAEWDYVVERLKYAEAEDVADMINDLLNDNSSRSGAKQNQNSAARTAATSATPSPLPARTPAKTGGKSGEADSRFGALTKEDATVLADNRINGLVIKVRKAKKDDLMKIIKRMDVKLDQVLIETAIIEVTLGDDLQTGVDWLQQGRHTVKETRQATDDLGRRLYWNENDEGRMVATTEESDNPVMETVSRLVKGDMWNGNNGYAHMLGGGGGGVGSDTLNMLMSVGSNVAETVTSLSPAGSGLNYFFKSDKLNLAAVIKASQSDSRAKYIASPVVMTVDNKEATIEATESRKFFNGYETSNSGYNYVRTPKYDPKDIGIKIKVTPKINPDGTVMLQVDEEYSQLGAGQSILVDNGTTAAIDTSLTRKMAADILLDNMQTVVLGGLTENYKSEKETGIPILKDIPWIGKWLFGSVSQSESRKELLVFMTPYVINDAETAQSEALRRKKALSDPSPWTNQGWSKSKLADPVAAREKLRRQLEEWKKQDEDHAAEVELDKARLDRVLKLKDRSIDDAQSHDRLMKDYFERLAAIEERRVRSGVDELTNAVPNAVSGVSTNAIEGVTGK